MIPALMPTYAREDLAFDHGAGAWLVTADGRRFLDFGAGIATSSLGHGASASGGRNRGAGRPGDARLQPVSGAGRPSGWPQRLVAATFADSVFFCNSGAEANEGAVKLMRRAMARPPGGRSGRG